MAVRKFKSDLMRSIYESAKAMHDVGAIDDARMRHYEKATMRHPPDVTPPHVPTATEIRQLREANSVSQPVFALYLGTSASTVRQWETGAKKPSGIAARMLEVVAKHGLKVLAA